MNDFLLVLAQIAVTLAGLTGILVAFSGSNGKLVPSDSLRVRVIVTAAIYSGFLALLPLALLSIEFAAPYAWTSSTVFYLLFMALFLFSQRRHELRAGKEVVLEIKGSHRQIAWGLASSSVLISLVNLSTLFGPVQPGLYLLTILFTLLTSGIVFLGLVYHRLL